jgi:hypothetical protein
MRQRRWGVGWVIGVALLLGATSAHAVTPTGFLGDTFGAGIYNSLRGVWIPLAALVLILVLVGVLASGHGRQMSSRTLTIIFAILVLGGGISWASTISGGTFAESLTFPARGRGWIP